MRETLFKKGVNCSIAVNKKILSFVATQKREIKLLNHAKINAIR